MQVRAIPGSAPVGGQAVLSLSARPKRPGAASSAVPFHVEAQGNFALKSGARPVRRCSE